MTLNATHNAELQSWVPSANLADADFPIQNLPLGRFQRALGSGPWRAGVAVGDQVLDLHSAAATPWGQVQGPWLAPLAAGDTNAFMAMGPEAWHAMRAALSTALRAGAAEQTALAPCLLAQAQAHMGLPCHTHDYTDFYTGIHHATAVGKLFRPDQPLMPNYTWVPIGYHGRASSLRASGHGFHRPLGQTAGSSGKPNFGPSQRVDHELELAIWVGTGNALGQRVPLAEAESHLYGIGLLNDWSARDLQAWEYQPLGPFLAKSFATTVSPWMVSMEALAPFRAPFTRGPGLPEPLPYLDGEANRAQGQLMLTLEVWLQTAAMAAAGQETVRLSSALSHEAAFWTCAQLLTHHTVNGCNLQSGDLFGSGTLSGPRPEQAGSLLELTQGGKQPITLPNGEQRTFLQDGDTVILRGHATRPGAKRIGLGEARATVLAALP